MTHDEFELPPFFPLRQHLASHAIEDLDSAVDTSLEQASFAGVISRGQRVAVAVGSRGIANLGTIVARLVENIRELGAEPIIVPAMGSHGGATPEGQSAILAKYGVDSETLSCPLDASMETVHIGTTGDGVDVHFARAAMQADQVVVVNRIKPHTRLVGRFESGLVKMLMIGLGKQQGAELYHQVFPRYDYYLERLASEIVDLLLAKTPVSFGLAIVEDALEQTSLIEAVPAREFVNREPELLAIARQRMPKLPFEQADLLVVDQIGKEISGTGMDTNVIGRKFNDKRAAEDESPKVRQIYVRSLTPQTAGNACGIGIAEYCHRNVVQAMDHDVTRINCVTSAHVTAGAIPLTFESDREVLQAVVAQAAADRRDALKWIWIRDTLHLEHVACSAAYYDAARQRDDLECMGQPRPLSFDAQGNLVDLFDG